MDLSHEHVGSKMLEKIKIYILTRAELLFTLCYEIPCRQKLGKKFNWYFGKLKTHKTSFWDFLTFSRILNNIRMFGFVMQFQAQVIEKYTGTLVTHKFLFIFETRGDSSMNIFVMLDKIHGSIKFLITFKVIY